ncbi:hypothetical protein CKM354_001122400 [Cercospora kikuchii]|uniref:Uncharacterized protein n=1 Tax=Cercospora kikuchii TaxID=84275 RepID=A0A9P3FI44_9PEZI|nr:uncharacterized protein CKM354_001122400 [Cercospora kikuchii]GIZ48151.1 hypothetical protein CKM354_001122400 [Cercospora kikuchii]
MGLLAVPDAVVRLALLILTIASFIPQYRTTQERKNCDGVSLTYLLANIYITNYMLAMIIASMGPFSVEDYEQFFLGRSIDLRDLYDLLQFAVPVFGFATHFYQTLTLPPKRPKVKFLAVVIRQFILLTTMLPAIGIVFTADQWGQLVFMLPLVYAHPIVLIAAILGPIRQIFKMRHQPRPDELRALCPQGLLLQAPAFSLVGLSLLWRFYPGSWLWESHPEWRENNTIFVRIFVGLREWYRMTGWFTVDFLIIAFGQALVGYVAWKKQKQKKATSADEEVERQPLL